MAQFGIPQRKKDTSFEALNEMATKEENGGVAACYSSGVPDTPDLAAVQEMMDHFREEVIKTMEEMDPVDMIENIIDLKDEVLQNMEQSGLVSAEELGKFRNDPAYFESQMRNGFDQMAAMYSDPEALIIFEDDDKIEEARLQLLSVLSDPAVANNQNILQCILNDPEKWRESVKEGRSMWEALLVPEAV